MRIPAILTALALLCAPLVPVNLGHCAPAMPAPQATPAAMPACDGLLSITRISEITSTGSMDKFMAAVAAHQAWYASHGYSDVIFAARVMTHDPQSGPFSYSDKQVMTFHYIKPGGAPPTHDAAWDAYVKLYSDTSTIKETTLSCVPMVGAPASMK